MDSDNPPSSKLNFKNLHSREYVGHKKQVHSVAWNCTGRKLASCSVDFTVRIWQIETGISRGRELELTGHTASVDNVAWNPKHSEILTSVSSDKTVRLWDARSGKCEHNLLLKGENINVTYKPDGTQIAVGNNVEELTIIDVRKFKPSNKRKFSYEVNEISWDKTGELFFVSTGTGCIEILDPSNFETYESLQAHTASIYCLAIDPLGRYFAAGSADALVSIWDVNEIICVKTLTKLEWPVRTISFSHDGNFIASASEDTYVDIADVDTGRSVHQIPCRAAMNSVEWNPCFHLLAYASDDDGKYSVPGVLRVFGFESPELS